MMMHMRYFILLLCVGFALGSDTVPAKYCKLYNLLGLMDMTTADKLSPTINYYEKANPYLRISSKTLTLVQSGEVMNVCQWRIMANLGYISLLKVPPFGILGRALMQIFMAYLFVIKKGSHFELSFADLRTQINECL